jgi:hypothetical protein
MTCGATEEMMTTPGPRGFQLTIHIIVEYAIKVLYADACFLEVRYWILR